MRTYRASMYNGLMLSLILTAVGFAGCRTKASHPMPTSRPVVDAKANHAMSTPQPVGCMAGHIMSISEPIDQVHALIGGECGIVKAVDERGHVAKPGAPIEDSDIQVVTVAQEEINILLHRPHGVYRIFLEGKAGRKCTLDVDTRGSKEDRIDNFTLILKQTKAIITFNIDGSRLTLTATDARLLKKERKTDHTISIPKPIDQVGAQVYEKCEMVKIVDDKGRTATAEPMVSVELSVRHLIAVSPYEMGILLDEACGTYELTLKGQVGRKYLFEAEVLGGKESSAVTAFTLILKRARATITFRIDGCKLVLEPANAKLFARLEKAK